MAIFYSDSGSFDNLKISGSTLVSGSLIVTGSTYLKELGTTAQSNLISINTTTGQLFTISTSSFVNIIGYTESSPPGNGTIYSISPSSNAGNTSYISSIVLGKNAGASPTAFLQSNMIMLGEEAGATIGGTTNANSVFIGYGAGSGSRDNSSAIFIGESAGKLSNTSQYSNFIGYEAGYSASSYYSNIIGFRAGRRDSGAGIGLNNIIIGSSITLADGTNNALNIGGVLFGIEMNSPDLYNPSISGSAGGKIGINVPSPSTNFQVSGTVDLKGTTTITGSFAMSGSTLQFNIPSKAANYILKSDANGNATWDSVSNIIGNSIYSGSVTASVNTATASFFQVTSGSGASNQLFLIRDAANLGYNWPGLVWSSGNSLSIYSTSGVVRIGTVSANNLTFTTNTADRWAVNGSGHFVAGGENAYDIGTSTTGKVRNIYVTGSATINDVLTLPYQNPLPSGRATGSIALSGSGATFVGMFMYNGTSWVKLSV